MTGILLPLWGQLMLPINPPPSPTLPPLPSPKTTAAKLKRRQAALLRPANSGGGDADGADYAAALGQKLAAALAAAADDAAAVVGRQGGGGGSGGPGSDLSAAFLVWALYQTERWEGRVIVQREGGHGQRLFACVCCVVVALLEVEVDGGSCALVAGGGPFLPLLPVLPLPPPPLIDLSAPFPTHPSNCNHLTPSPPLCICVCVCLQGLPPAAQARPAALCRTRRPARLWPRRLCLHRPLRCVGGQPRAAAGADCAAGAVACTGAGECGVCLCVRVSVVGASVGQGCQGLLGCCPVCSCGC